MSAVNGEHSSAALVAGGTAAMSILYAIHPHEGSSDMESMTFFVDIDAVAQEIQRVCTGAVMGQLCAHYFGLHVDARVRGSVVFLNLN
ncbi:hypothetical protein PI125_g6728 [Phytophthora idaei]|nr:hypothetical protein PI125_g6728 [Phytophthora idaei]